MSIRGRFNQQKKDLNFFLHLKFSHFFVGFGSICDLKLNNGKEFGNCKLIYLIQNNIQLNWIWFDHIIVFFCLLLIIRFRFKFFCSMSSSSNDDSFNRIFSASQWEFSFLTQKNANFCGQNYGSIKIHYNFGRKCKKISIHANENR